MKKFIKKLFAKRSKKTIWIAIIILIVIVVLVLNINARNKNNSQKYTFEKVAKGNIEQTVSETGTVGIADEINLSFKNGGEIKNIAVKIGDKVIAGEFLTSIDSSELNIQLSQADAALASAQAQLDKLIAGSTQEDINLAKARVESSQTTLTNKEKDLANTKLDADSDLVQIYQDSLNDLNDAYLDIYDSYTDLRSLQRAYFMSYDQESVKVKQAEEDIQLTMNYAKNYINLALSNPTNENIDKALTETKTSLDNTYGYLSTARDACEADLYRDKISSTDKTTLDNNKAAINTSRVNILSAQQSISSTKITNLSNINSAEALVSSAQKSLTEAQISLEKTLAGPTKEDIEIYEARILGAKSDKAIIANKIAQTILRSPVNGEIVKVEKRVGETASPSETIVSILPNQPFQIKVNIYEEDIAKLIISDPVRISLVAFPEETLAGKVSAISPIEQLVNGIVYYEVTIDFDEKSEKIKPGMTADIIITTDAKENVLIVPEASLIKADAATFVNILIDKKIGKKEITTGLAGDEGKIEVLAGLTEGETIVINK